jgi:hypothetical protein
MRSWHCCLMASWVRYSVVFKRAWARGRGLLFVLHRWSFRMCLRVFLVSQVGSRDARGGRVFLAGRRGQSTQHDRLRNPHGNVQFLFMRASTQPALFSRQWQSLTRAVPSLSLTTRICGLLMQTLLPKRELAAPPSTFTF